MSVYVICLFISLNMLVLYQVHIILVYGKADRGPNLMPQIYTNSVYYEIWANLCDL